MPVLRDELIGLRSTDDIIKARQLVRDCAIFIGLSLVDQTKVVTAASELARNALVYGLGGTVRIETLLNDRRSGLRLIFEDHGPGIADTALALTDGYTTGNGLGLGLSGARRLCQDFELVSRPGEGTRVTIARWK